MTADVRGWLRRLDETHQKATPGVWAQHPADGWYVIGDVRDGGESYLDVADAAGSANSDANAAAIVAAHNAVPDLIAALTAVLDLADELEAASDLPTTHGEFDRGVAAHQRDAAERLRAAVAAPLAGHDNEEDGR